MEYESFDGMTLPKIGFGTARVGGRIIPNPFRDAAWIKILRSALDLGYTHFDTAELYALGYSETLIGRALRESGILRRDVLLTTKVWLNHLNYAGVLHACEKSLRRLGTDYLDMYLIHLPNPLVPLEETFRALNRLVRAGRIRHVGVSNFKLDLLQRAQLLCDTPLITNQVPYSIHEREYARNGVLAHCQENGILLTAYTPLRHKQIQSSRVLRKIAEVHDRTPHQVALAWLTSQSRVITIPMSFDPQHQKENLIAGDVKLSNEELKQLDGLANPAAAG
jgi:2,5-diketo-D-gluconate reductase B